MMSQPARTSMASLARVAQKCSASATRRQFTVASSYRRPDIVQDLYLRELRAYKQPVVKPGDADAHVQKFNMPKAPKSPEEASLTNQMHEYESAPVEVEGQAATGESQEPDGDYFEDFKTMDEEQPAAH